MSKPRNDHPRLLSSLPAVHVAGVLLGGLLALGHAPASHAAPPSPSIDTSGLVSAQCILAAHERLGAALLRCERKTAGQGGSKLGSRMFASMCVFTAQFHNSLDVARCNELGLDPGGPGGSTKKM